MADKSNIKQLCLFEVYACRHTVRFTEITVVLYGSEEVIHATGWLMLHRASTPAN